MLAVLIPILAMFGPALVTDRSFAFRDAAHFYYPLFEWCAREWGAGRIPLWNPQENAGIPVLADTSSSVFYPGKLVFALPLDFSLRYKLYVVGHVLLAAVGSYWLARSWRASRHAAAIAATSYACGGGVVFQYSNVVFLVGSAWLPIAGVAMDGMLRERSWRAVALLGAALAMMILGGDPQMALNTLLIACLYAVVLTLAKQEPAESSPAALGEQIPRWRALAGGVLLVGAAAIAGFLLSAVQVLPSWEATKYSERAAFNRPRNIYEVAHVLRQPADSPQPFGETRRQSITRGIFGEPEPQSHHDLAYDFSIGPWRLAEYFWPNIGGRMFPTNRRWLSLVPAEGRTWTPTLYLGLLPILVALSCFRVRGGSSRQRWLSWLVLIFTLGTFGWYGLGWLAREMYATSGGDPEKLGIGSPVGGVYWLMVTFLPSYAYFRYPAKLLPLVSLGLSQLAAIGWDRAFAERRPRLELVLKWLGVLSGVVAFVFWCGGSWFLIKSNRIDPSLGPFDSGGAYRDILGALVHTALVSLAGYWLLRRAWEQPAKQSQWQTAALLLTAAELAVANYWLVPTAPASLWRTESPIAATIEAADTADSEAAAAPPPRVLRGSMTVWRPPSFARSGSLDRITQLDQWEHDTLFPKYQLASDVALVESYGSIKLMDYESLLFVARQLGRTQPDKSTLQTPTALRLLGTEYLLLPESSRPPFAEPIAPPPELANWPENTTLWRMKRTLPRAWIVRSPESLPPLQFPLRVEAVDERTRRVLFPGPTFRDFRVTAVVEPHPSIRSFRTPSPEPVPLAGEETCRITRYEPTRVVVEATLPQTGLVVLSDAWFPGWKATAQTEPRLPEGTRTTSELPIVRTNRFMRGVFLPAGRHTIEYRYEPASFRWGTTVSAISWLGLIALGIAALVRSRTRPLKSSSSAPA
jgi:hypothetical protein